MPNITNQTFLQHTADVLSNLEVRYQEASFDEQVQLRDLLDQAMNSYSSARLTLFAMGLSVVSERREAIRALLVTAADPVVPTICVRV